MSPDEELELAALVGLAWERRGEPDFRDRIEAIVGWHDRRQIRAFERRQRSRVALIQLLRETDPAQITGAPVIRRPEGRLRHE